MLDQVRLGMLDLIRFGKVRLDKARSGKIMLD